jgi:hypothetical protein
MMCSASSTPIGEPAPEENALTTGALVLEVAERLPPRRAELVLSPLGDRENGRHCYDEGVQWMEQNLPEHADLRRLRAEAARMLGITGAP